MPTSPNSADVTALSIAHGIPLSHEPGIGVLTLPAYIREVTSRYAGREALVAYRADGAVDRWSYAQLWDHACAVARALIARGVPKESRVGVLMTNSPEWIASFFGIGLAGGVAVTLSTFATSEELEYMLKASGVGILLFEHSVLRKDFAQMLEELEPLIAQSGPGQLISPKFPFLRHLAMVGKGPGRGAIETMDAFLAAGAAIPNAMVDAAAAAVAPADPGALFFSSGSTGKPKGILNSHRGVTIQAWRWARMYGLHDDVRTWSANGFFWSGNFGTALGSTLSTGGAIVLQPTFQPVEALAMMEAERVTLACAWPHQWAQMEATAQWQTTDLSSFRYVDPGHHIRKAHPTIATPWREPRWAYGNTETFTINTMFAAGTSEEEAGDSHGEPLPGNTIKIVDPISGETVPLGQIGEIAVKGPTLMLGYIGIPLDETLDEQGFFRTGDGGYLDERGRLFWQGRLNDIIKTGGANVAPAEIDNVVRDYPGVKVSQTVGVPHETLGEMVVACVVVEEGHLVEEAPLRDYLKTRLASYKVPRRVLVVSEDDLSFTGSAKVKTQALRELAAARLEQTRV